MELTDPQAIRALSHPLRLDLIELLGAGPATAAECARALGSTQANCSFHLRQLAKYGFVAEAPAGDDRRERRWQLVDYEQSWSSADDPALTNALDQVFARREASRLIDYTARLPTEPEEWRRASMLGGATLPLTADELDDVSRRIATALRDIIPTYMDRIGDRSTWPPGARPSRILLAAMPLLLSLDAGAGAAADADADADTVTTDPPD
ncbi:MAG TPA: winged helix-turn-helix domain-containing protein [Micromonosporaceae bacterium]|nr:winged helix-turn-helix domain-containing protein [Micromonosporaceae bacterium]